MSFVCVNAPVFVAYKTSFLRAHLNKMWNLKALGYGTIRAALNPELMKGFDHEVGHRFTF